MAHLRQSLFATALLVSLAAPPGAQQPQASGTDLATLLAYPATNGAPRLTVISSRTEGTVTVEDVTFESVAGNPPIQAYLIRPTTRGTSNPAVLFVHWFAPPDPTSNRTQFVEEATALARRGTISLLVSTFWSDPARYQARRWETDFSNSVAQAKDLRRALDVLVAQPGVDTSRIAYVGHDYGAMFGAVVSAVDPRPKSYVIIAAASRFANWYVFGSASGVPTGAALDGFRAQLAPIEPVNTIKAAKASLFFQFGENDRYTPREDFVSLYMAAPQPKRIATYASDHDMVADIIRHDRTVWLGEQLKLPPEGPLPRR
jgi:dienelactone hydrolase